MTEALNIRDVQATAWKNKIDKGFNTTNVPLEFCYLEEELAEAFRAWRKGLPDLDEELADVALFLVALAEMNSIDLQSAIERKLAKNAGRTYVAGEDGRLVRTDQVEDPRHGHGAPEGRDPGVRQALDRAIEQALPVSGGRIRPLLERLRTELGRVDRIRHAGLGLPCVPCAGPCQLDRPSSPAPPAENCNLCRHLGHQESDHPLPRDHPLYDAFYDAPDDELAHIVSTATRPDPSGGDPR